MAEVILQFEVLPARGAVGGGTVEGAAIFAAEPRGSDLNFKSWEVF